MSKLTGHKKTYYSDWNKEELVNTIKAELVIELSHLTGPGNKYASWTREELVNSIKVELAKELENLTGQSSKFYSTWSRDELTELYKSLVGETRSPQHVTDVINARSKKPASKRSKSMKRSESSNGLLKKDLVDELSKLTGQTKKFYNSWSKDELIQRLEAAKDENWNSEKSAPKRMSRPSRRSSRRSRRTAGSKSPCKPYQNRVNGRCVNKPCKEGKIRDRITKRCRNKK